MARTGGVHMSAEDRVATGAIAGAAAFVGPANRTTATWVHPLPFSCEGPALCTV